MQQGYKLIDYDAINEKIYSNIESKIDEEIKNKVDKYFNKSLKYQIVYKCRLCGAIERYHKEFNSPIKFINFNDGTIIDNNLNIYEGIDNLITHTCGDGSIGMCDLQGLKNIS